jgi:alkylation response protein AidB-like acyl-CoA dehydrogenase
MNPMGMPEMRIALLPQPEARILNTWDVSGMAATGSHDFELQEHFIPAARMLAPVPQASFNRHFQGPAHTLFPFMANFGFAMGMVALGIARGAIDYCSELAITKVPRGSDVPLRDRPLFQYRLADAVAIAASARSWLIEELRRCWEMAHAGQPVDVPQRNRLALAAAHATRSGAAATDLMYTAGGGTAIYRKNPLQRAMRDVHAVTQHIATSPQSIENAGRVLMGQPVPLPLLLL